MQRSLCKKILFVVISILIVMGFVYSIPVYANENRPIRVGYYENEVFQEGASEGTAKSGYAYEYYRKISEYTGWEYEYVYDSYNNLFKMLVDGDIDLLAGIAMNTKRKRVISYPDRAMGNELYNLIKHNENKSITSDPASFTGKKIGVLDSAIVDILGKFLDVKDIECKIITYDDYSSLFADYDTGKLDMAAVEGSGTYGREASEVVCTFGASEYYLCVNKRRADILDELNEAQMLLSVEEPNYISNLKNRYYSGSISSLAFSDLEKEWIANNDSLVVGYMEDLLPYSDTDADGNVTGIVKDAVSQILRELNLSKVDVSYKGYGSYSDMLADLDKGIVDITFPIGGNLYYSEENGIYQSSPVISTNNELVYKDDIDNHHIKTMAVNRNNGLQYYYVLANFPDTELKYYNSTNECLEAVINSEADATVLNSLRAYNILRNSIYHDLSVIQLGGYENICFGIDIGNKSLLKLINRGISVLDDDYIFHMADRYTDKLYYYTINDFLKDHAEATIVVMIVAFITILLIFIINFHEKVEKEKKQRFAIQKIFDQMIMAFAKIIDKKDEYTSGHSFRVAEYSRKLALKLGYDKAFARKVYNIALLHDIGKIAVPDYILNKPGELNDTEYSIIKEHAALGKDILLGIDAIPEISLGAGYHHEKYDGSGYPEGLKGDEIPEIAQIISIADAFDAMYSTRPYRNKMDLEDCLEEIRKGAGIQFNPELSKAFIEMVQDGWLDKSELDEKVLWW